MAKGTNFTIKHPAISEFGKLLTRFYGHSLRMVYADFLQLAVCAFLSDHTAEHPREQQYNQIMDKYREKEQKDAFPAMLAAITRYMQETGQECLSILWEEIGANLNMEQFFTPAAVCGFMAETEIGQVKWENYTQDHQLYICDPACGGGRTLVAAIKQIPAEHADKICCIGIDIDESVCNIALLNMLFFNANALIIHGNALDQSVWHLYGVNHGPIGGELEEYTDKNDKDVIGLFCCCKATNSKPKPKQQLQQVDLFGGVQ